MRKYIALLLIFLFVGLCAFIAFDSLWLSALSTTEMAAGDAFVAALAIDGQGNAYYVLNDEGNNVLYGLDDTGNIIAQSSLKEILDARTHLVEQLYVTANKNVVVAAYTLGEERTMVSALSVHMYHEDGTHAVRALNRPLEMPIERISDVRVSGISEDENNIYFSVYTEGLVENFYMPHGAYEIAQKHSEWQGPTAAFAGFFAGAGGEAYFATARGEILCMNGEKETWIRQAGWDALAGSFYQGQEDGLYYQDVTTGGLYLLHTQTGVSSIVTPGSQSILREEELLLSDLSLYAVNQNGRLAGVRQDGKGERIFYSGGTGYVSRIEVKNAKSGGLRWLVVAGIALGALLISILIWQAYCYLLKMRVSAILRQLLLTALCVLATLYTLLAFIIRPNIQALSEDLFSGTLREGVKNVSAIVLAAEQSEIPAALAAAFALPQAEQECSDTQAVIRYDIWDQNEKLLGSSAGLTAGATMNLALRHTGIRDAVEEMRAEGQNERLLRLHEEEGSRMYVVELLDNGMAVSASAELFGLYARLDALVEQVINFLVIAGVFMVVLLVVVECTTVYSIRKLRKGLDAVSSGDYDAEISVNSGDEVEDLTNSFNTMTKLVRSTIRSLNGANKALYRFVPESLVRLLEADSVEELSRETHVQKEMTILYMQFWLAEGAPTSEELFNDINETIGALTSAVFQNGGTVYGFRYDGFQAVFDGEPEAALRAALYIRELAGSLNQKREGRGRKAVDVRVALGMGPVMLGVVGDTHRMSPVAVSGAIGLAADVMALSRESGLYITCTRPVFERLEGYKYRYIGKVADGAGYADVYDLYEGDPYTLLKHKQTFQSMFDEARDAFYARDFETARRLFMQIVRDSPEDGVAKHYMYHADRYRAEAPGIPQYKLFMG